MTILFARHQVNDYGAWRKVYDSVAPMQKQNGVVSEAVYQSEDDANDVTVMHEFKSAREAKAFAGSKELRDAMVNAGVQGNPTIWFVHKA